MRIYCMTQIGTYLLLHFPKKHEKFLKHKLGKNYRNFSYHNSCRKNLSGQTACLASRNNTFLCWLQRDEDNSLQYELTSGSFLPLITRDNGGVNVAICAIIRYSISLAENAGNTYGARCTQNEVLPFWLVRVRAIINIGNCSITFLPL